MTRTSVLDFQGFVSNSSVIYEFYFLENISSESIFELVILICLNNRWREVRAHLGYSSSDLFCHCRPLSWLDQSWLPWHGLTELQTQTLVYNKSWNQILWCQALDPIMTLCVLLISPSIAIIFYIYVHRYNCVSQDIISGHLVVSKNYPCELSIKCWNFHFWNWSSWNSLESIGLFSVDFSGSIRIFSQNWYENICVMSGRCGTRDRKTESVPFTRKRVISTYFEREMPLQ